MKIAEQVTFGGAGINRAAELRGDSDEIDAMLGATATRFLPLWRGKPLIGGEDRNRLAFLSGGHDVLGYATEAPIFLGMDDEGAIFALDISAWAPEDVDPEALGQFLDPSEQHHAGLVPDERFSELRAVMARLTPRDAEVAATAKAVLGWHQTHGFCAACGQKSEIVMAGWQRQCPDCGAMHFPRTDPVVIMLILNGNDVLIGRSPGWPEGMYSLLAGFVEPGEPIEAAVRREVFEETGVRVGAVSYLASQPWPFPASLMIGCHGVAESRDITIDPAEIEDALWLSREDMMQAISGQHPTLLPARKGSIAHFLLSNWLADRLD
ncbi:NAD(+) diphosphatase [Aliiroseovarius sp. YM-037]|uniref:NAD(+) diphosphatase n=1 Tax=Aliiroseovarius sp. YM-037 TaxID=3341728 RepID=UPI003A8086B4